MLLLPSAGYSRPRCSASSWRSRAFLHCRSGRCAVRRRPSPTGRLSTIAHSSPVRAAVVFVALQRDIMRLQGPRAIWPASHFDPMKSSSRKSSRPLLSSTSDDPSTDGHRPPVHDLPAPLGKADVRNIFFGLMLAMFLSALNQTIVATALPTIGRDFGDFENLSWVIIAYLLSSTVVSPLY